MVSIIGNIKINSVYPSSTVLVGNTASVILSSNSKIYAGANSFSIGDSIGTNITNNAFQQYKYDGFRCGGSSITSLRVGFK